MKLQPSYSVPKKIRQCSICKTDFEWNEEKGSAWFGNYQIIGKGRNAHEEENILAIACSFQCQKKFNEEI